MSINPTRRTLLRSAGLGAAALSIPATTGSAAAPAASAAPAPAAAGGPNTGLPFRSGVREALELGAGPMQKVFNPEDHDIPWFGHDSQPALGGRSRFGFSGAHDESHTPGRHLLGLLEARSIGVRVADSAVRKHRDALYFGLSREVPLPQNRSSMEQPKPTRFITHNIREGLHGLFALYAHTPEYAVDARARFERAIAAIDEFWSPGDGWDGDALRRRQADIDVQQWGSPLITGLARAIGPLTRYWRLSVTRKAESKAARKLLDELVGATIEEFPVSGVNTGRLGTHTHSITCTVSGLAAYAFETGDAEVAARVRAFYRLGLTTIRDEFGWSIENTSDTSDRGECNNTGDILETAILLGHLGDPEAYSDAARILRGHLLPAQLLDPSFMHSPKDPWDDSERDVGARLRGAFGFPAPYGHLPEGWKSASFNLDIVGGAVSSLVFAHKHAVRQTPGALVVALPIDHDSEVATVRVRQHGGRLQLRVRPRAAGDVLVTLPAWAEHKDIEATGIWEVPDDGSAVRLRSVPAGREVLVSFRTASRTMRLGHTRRAIRVLLEGDHVTAMDNHGTELAFFPPYPAEAPDPAKGEVARWTFGDVANGTVQASDGLVHHRLTLTPGAAAVPLADAPGGHALRLNGQSTATAGLAPDFNFGTAGFTVAAWIRTTMRGVGRVVSKGSYGWTPGYFLSVGHGGDGCIGFGIGGGSTWGGGGSVETTTSESLVADGAWHHVCATYDGLAGEIRLYVDGVARPQSRRGGTDGKVFGDVLRLRDSSPAIAAGSLALTVGSHLGRDELFTGDIADLRFFGSGLPAGTVAMLARR